jgi:hypothetical protein
LSIPQIVLGLPNSEPNVQLNAEDDEEDDVIMTEVLTVDKINQIKKTDKHYLNYRLFKNRDEGPLVV